MRTKALIGLAALVASTAGLTAQVYSLNIVGYYNTTMKPGYNLVANQLKTGANTLADVLPASAELTQVLKYSGGSYVTDISDGTAWLDATTGNPSTTTVAPGEGFFYFNPGTTDKTVTFVGEVTTGTGLKVTAKPGYNLASSIVPQKVDLTAANGFPQVELTQYLSYGNGTYSTLINDGTAWLDATTGNPAMASPEVGQGFFIFNPGTTDMVWTRDFTVQ